MATHSDSCEEINYEENYVMYLRTVQSSAIRVLIEALKEILTDTNLEFDSQNIKVIAMDPSHTVLVHLLLDSNKFERYFCPNRLLIGINTINLFKLIKALQNNDILTLFIEKNNTNQLGIRMENGEANQITQYKMNLMDLNQDNISIPPIEFESVITLPSNNFQKICRDMFNLSDNIEITTYGQQITFKCKGDIADQETSIGQSQTSGMSLVKNDSENQNQNEIIQGVFSLKYLVLFTKCTNLSSSIELYLKNDYPLIIRYQVANLGEVKLCLAPVSIHD
tara:strand:- start:2831 stop:3670 length:840 start_codon:yes stop_codon:yes gene_type:complete